MRFSPGCSGDGCDCGGTCTRCQSASSDSMEVTITGLANGTCGVCGILDGTYTCTRLTASDADFTLTGTNCYWVYYFPGSPSCSAIAVFVLLGGTATDGKVEVGIKFAANERFFLSAIVAYTGSGTTSQVDCAFSSLALTFDRYFTAGSPPCDASAATATLTAV